MLYKFGFASMGIAAAVLCTVPQAAQAEGRQLRITIPGYSRLTPVQQLNRQGVEAARKHQVEKAQAFFYKAYLYDPTDPFTLNNLGYAAELQGDADRAEKFYGLAEKQDCDAVIDLASLDALKGKPMLYALQDLKDATLRLNRMNVQAIELLLHDRGFEAVRLLERTAALDPQNLFTLNNLGVAEEFTGDLEGAAAHYGQVVNAHSTEAVVVSPNHAWRGKPVSRMAEANLKRVEQRLREEGPAKARAAMLAIRGVAALNGNNWAGAKEDFLEAYALDPAGAFALNNLGYVSERDGDLETAQLFYSKARHAEDAQARIGLASTGSVQGQALSGVAASSAGKVSGALDRFEEKRRLDNAEPELVPRGASTVADPTTSSQSETQNPQPQPQVP